MASVAEERADALRVAGVQQLQHLIDPVECIRCRSCEDVCARSAIRMVSGNLVVDPRRCDHCLDCVGVCPTGAIDNWRIPPLGGCFSIDEQQAWSQLPANELP